MDVKNEKVSGNWNATHVGSDAELGAHLGQRVDVLPGLVTRGSSELTSLEVPLAALDVLEDREHLVALADDALDV